MAKKTLELLVSANVEASIEQINKDLDTIQKRIKTSNIEVKVDARIQKIHIDKTAVTYVTKEIQKMFNTVTVDIDGNILGVGKGKGVQKQAESVQKMVLDAQKRLANVNTDYGDNMDPGQLLKMQQFTAQFEALKNNVNATATDVKAFTTDLDIFTKAVAKSTKETVANAKAQESQAKAVATAVANAKKQLGIVEVDYGTSGSSEIDQRLKAYRDQLDALAANPAATTVDVQNVAAEISKYTRELNNNTKALAKNEAASKASAKAEATRAKSVDLAVLEARKKLSTLEGSYSIDNITKMSTVNVYRKQLDDLQKSSAATVVDVKRVSNAIELFGQKLAQEKKNLASGAKETEKLEKAYKAFGSAVDDVNKRYSAYMNQEQEDSFRFVQEEYQKYLQDTPENNRKASDVEAYTAYLENLRKELEYTIDVQNEFNKAVSIKKDIQETYGKTDTDIAQVEELKNVIEAVNALEVEGNFSGAKIGDLKVATAALEKYRKELKQQADAEKANTAQVEKAENDRVKSIEKLAAAQKELIGSANTLSGLYGDYKMHGAFAESSAATQIEEYVKYIEGLNEAHGGPINTEFFGEFNTDLKNGKVNFAALNNILDAFIENLDTLGAGGTDSITELLKVIETAQKETDTLKLKLRNDMNFNQDEASANAFKNSIASSIHQLDEFYSKYYKIRLNGSMAAEYNTIRDEFSKIEIGDNASLKTAEGHLAQFIARAKEAGLTTETLSEKVQKAFQKFGGWSLITGIMMKAINSVRNMVSTVIELDTALTELKKVTEETSDSYDAFLQRTKSTAKEIGSTMADVVSATADWARLGYEMADAENLAKASLIYANVGDELEGVDEASSHLISTMQAFKIEASDVMTIVDQLNTVGNTQAISSGGTGEALARSAAALEAAGNSLQESMAMIAAMNTTLQNPEAVGTTMKTLSMYLRAAKTELEDAGESTDGMATSVSQLRSSILALTGNKVDIQIDDDTFKSTYQIMKELAAVWDELSDVAQADLLNQIAGKRNANAVSALLESFDIAEDTMKELENSAGSAAKENQKYLDSIEGRLQKFRATYESLATTVANSDWLKRVVSAGTALLSLVDKLTQKMGAVPPIITSIVTAMSVGGFGLIDFKIDTDGTIFDDGLIASAKKNKDQYKKISAEIEKYNSLVSDIAKLDDSIGNGEIDFDLYGSIYTDFTAQMDDCADEIGVYNEALAESMRGHTDLTQKNKEYLNSLKNIRGQLIKTKLETVAANLALSALASVVVSLVVHLGSKLYDALVVTSEEMQNCEAAASSLADSLEENDNWIASIGELQQKLADENLSLSEQQSLKESLLSIQDAIIEKYGDEAGAIDLVNGKYAEMIEYLDEVNAKEFDTWRINNRDAIKKSIDRYTFPEFQVSFGIGQYNDFLKKASLEDADAFRKIIGIYESATEGDISGLKTNYVGDLESLSDQLVYAYELVSKYNTNGEFDSLLGKISNLSKRASDDITTYGDTYKQYMQGVISTNKALSGSYDSVETASDDFNKTLIDGTPEEVASAYDTLQTAVDSFMNAIGRNAGENAEEIGAYYRKSFDEVLQAAKAKTVTVDLKADDSSLRQDVVKAIESMNQMGYTSAPEIKSALTTGAIWEYSDAFVLLTDLSEDLDTTLVGVIDKLEELGYFGEVETAAVSDNIQKAIDSYMSMADALSAVRDEQEKHGSVSMDTYRKLMDMGEDYADVLELQNGAYVFSADAAQKLLDEQYEVAYSMLASENATEEQIAALQVYYGVMKNTRTQISEHIEKIQALNGIQDKVAEGTQFTADEVNELLEAYPELSFVVDETTGYWDLQVDSLDKVRKYIEKLINAIIEYQRHLTELQQNSALEDAGWKTADTLRSTITRFVNESGAKSVQDYADYYGLNVADIPEHTKKVIELEIQLSGDLETYEKMLSGDVPTDGFGSTGSSSKSSSKDTSNDTWKEAFEEQYKELQHQKAMERITEQEYLDGVEALYKTYFSNLAKYRDEYYQYEEEVYSGRQGLIDEFIEDLEKEYEFLGDEQKVLEGLNKVLRERQDILSEGQVETINAKTLDYQEKAIRKQIDVLEEQVDILDDKENSEEETIECYKQMINLLYDIKAVYADIYDENSDLMISLNGEISDLFSSIAKAKKALWEAQRDAQVDALEEEQDAIDDYKDAIDDILGATVDLIKRETEAEIEALEDAQDARDEWYDNEIDRIEEVADARKEALEDELDGYRKIIEAKKEALQDEADEEDYNTEVEKRVKEISDLQSKIDILSLDDSKAAAAERLELEETLQEKKDELQKYQRDYSLDKQLEALDKELDAFEDQTNGKIDLIEEQEKADKERIENQKKLMDESYEAQIKALRDHLDKEGILWQEANERLRREGSTLFAELRSYAAEYTTDVEGLEEAWKKVMQAVEAYNGGTLDLIDTKDNMTNISNKNETTIKDLENTTYEDTQNTPTMQQERNLINQYKSMMQTSSQAWKDANAAGNQSEMDYWANRNQELAKELNDKLGRQALTYNKWKGLWYLDGVRFYHKGGVVGDTSSLQQNEMLAVLKKQEMVLTTPMQETLAKYIQFAKTSSHMLTSLLSDDPVKNIVSGLQKRGGNYTTESSTIHVDKLFEFHADNITKDALPETESMLKRAADYTVRKLEDRLSRRGIKTKTSGV